MTSRSRRSALLGLGLVAGFASGFLGIGGGIVLVPALMLLLGYAIKDAVGISLPTVLVVATMAALSELYVNAARVDAAAAALLIAGSLAGSWLGGRVLRRVPDVPLRLAFAVVLAWSAIRLVVGRPAHYVATALNIAVEPLASQAIVLVIGLVAGVASVFFGVGGGIVIVPALLQLFPDASFHAVAATSLVTIVPTTALSVWQHRRLGTIDLSTVAWLAPIGVLGAVGGVLSAGALPGTPCRIAFAAFLLFAIARIVTRRREVDHVGASDLDAVIAAIRSLPAHVRDNLHGAPAFAAARLDKLARPA